MLLRRTKAKMDVITLLSKEEDDMTTKVDDSCMKSADKKPSMAAEDVDDFINLLIVDKTGEGKSSTANTIIGERKFRTSAGSWSVSKDFQKVVIRVQGQAVVVVDGPGLADTDMSTHEGLKQLETEITNILTTQPDGFDAILIVTKFGKRLTAEDCQVFDQLEKFFGRDFFRDYGILLVTCADNYDPEENDNLPIEKFLRSEKGSFRDMLRKCNKRLICFDNRTKDESVRQAQVKRLLDMVAEIKQNSERYTSEIFKKAQQERDEAILKSKEPFIRDKTERSLRQIIEELEKLPYNMDSVERLMGLKAKLEEQSEELIKQDMGTKALEVLIFKVKGLQNMINGVIEGLVSLHEMKKENEERARKEEERRAKWEEEEKARRKEEEKRARREAEERIRYETGKWEEIGRVLRQMAEEINMKEEEMMKILNKHEGENRPRRGGMEKAEKEEEKWMKNPQAEREKEENGVRKRWEELETVRREEMQRSKCEYLQREKRLLDDVKNLRYSLDGTVTSRSDCSII